jgi:hypothetical protein
MNTTRKTLVVSLLCVMLVMFVSSGIGSALDTNGLTAHAMFSENPLPAGETVTFRVIFASNNSETLKLNLIGLHFDWMPTDGIIGHNFTLSPPTLQNGASYTSDPIQISIPSSATSGTHSYYIAVDGYEGSDDTPFSYTSETLTVEVLSDVVATPKPTATTSGGNNNQTGEPLNLWTIIAIAAIIAVVVLVVLVFMMWRKRAPAAPAAPAPTVYAPPSQPPAQPPAQNPPAENPPPT